MIRNAIYAVCAIVVMGLMAISSVAQSRGPFAAHPGLEITTAFESDFGPDAESKTVISNVDPQGVSLSYRSSRGVISQRRVLRQDMMSSPTFVMGYATNMPQVIPGTTATGLSTAALEQLRSTGSVPYSLIYDANLSRIDGRLDLVKQLRFSVLIENQLVSLPALLARGSFASGNRRGTAEFYIYDDRNNPIILQSTVNFSWEGRPRTERIVHVTAGGSERMSMEQTLKTIRKVDLYGIHFDFDKATIRPEAADTIADIAETLRVNPGWRLLIKGHTDSIGKADYNLRLSQRRADSVRAALVNQYGIAPDRLETQGLGSSQPKGRNDTLQGRKQNRRVELVRIDR
jgi:outer membrane protein OmpA-like peptidoglycan-associated protein